MAALLEQLALKANPFEHYTAETEPDIAQYAVRPPYLRAIIERARGLTSFILFGDRGAGKSATRITVYNAVWGLITESGVTKEPFVVNLTDYTRLLEEFKREKLTDRAIVAQVSFIVIEQVLVWLSSLEESDRDLFVEALNKEEKTLIVVLIKAFYLPIPEVDREVSTSDAMKLLNSAWGTKSAVWMQQRWGAISKVVAALANALGRKALDDSIDLAGPAEALLNSLVGDSTSAPRATLNKLVELVRIFGFSGLCILIDKLDETPQTANSAESTARLIYPLLSHIQLLEISGFSWIFFLWGKVKDHFVDKYPVRLDKLAHANITWNAESLREMVEARVRFYSNQNLSFRDLFAAGVDVDQAFDSLRATAVNSPRELIKLLDTVIREHDARDTSLLIDALSLEIAQDKFAVETIGTWFADRPLQQVLRLGKTVFVNRDVQGAFKISDQGARVKITKWEDAGLVVQNGTVPSESGGKHSYRYEIADARVARIINRKLLDVVGAEIGADEFPEENTEITT